MSNGIFQGVNSTMHLHKFRNSWAKLKYIGRFFFSFEICLQKLLNSKFNVPKRGIVETIDFGSTNKICSLIKNSKYTLNT